MIKCKIHTSAAEPPTEEDLPKDSSETPGGPDLNSKPTSSGQTDEK